MLGAGEARHVSADLGNEHLGGAPSDTGDGLEQRDRLSLSDQALFELGIEARDRGVQVLEVSELLTQEEDVVGLQPADDCLGKRVPLGAQLPARQLGQRPRVCLAVEQSLQDLPRRIYVCPL